MWPHGAGRYQLHGRYGQFAIFDPRLGGAVTCTAHSERVDALMDALHELVLDRLG